ncbi:hypothetical protein JCM8202_004682 [Rhodotorula sphaerocarpa]
MTVLWSDLDNNVSPGAWYKDRSLRRNVLLAFICWFGSFCLGYGQSPHLLLRPGPHRFPGSEELILEPPPADGSYMNGLQAMSTWNEAFGHPAGNKLGIISASSYLPSLVVLPVFPIICDRLGRRWTAVIGGLVTIVGAIIGAAANDLGMLIVGRAIVGPGGSLLLLATNLLLNETLHPRFRAVGASVFLCFLYVGSITSSLISFGAVQGGWRSSWSWRLPTLLQALGPLVILGGLPWLPESPRYLVSKGKRQQALQILAQQHANGKEDDPLVLFELGEIEGAIEREIIQKQGFRAFFKTKGNRHRLLILLSVGTGTQGLGNAVLSYYLAPVLILAGITSSVQQTGLNVGLQIFNLIAALIGASLTERVGRRPLWKISSGAMLVAFSGLLAMSAGFAETGKKNLGFASIAFIFLSYGAYDIAWTPLAYSYTTEILPYSLRASGISLLIWVQNATLCANQWVNPIGLGAAGWKFYFLFIATIIFFNIMVWWKFVETKGLSLEEVCLIFDGNEATNMHDRKEAADAQVKYDRKMRETSHLEDVGEAKDIELAGEEATYRM